MKFARLIESARLGPGLVGWVVDFTGAEDVVPGINPARDQDHAISQQGRRRRRIVLICSLIRRGSLPRRNGEGQALP